MTETTGADKEAQRGKLAAIMKGRQGDENLELLLSATVAIINGCFAEDARKGVAGQFMKGLAYYLFDAGADRERSHDN